MAAKSLGLVALGLGGLAVAGSAAGYLAWSRPAETTAIEVSAPSSVPATDLARREPERAAPETLNAAPAGTPNGAPPLATTGAPIGRTKQPQVVTKMTPPQVKPGDATHVPAQTAPPPAPEPAVPAATPPVVEPPTSVTTEPPRYVPDPPLPAATTTEAQDPPRLQFDEVTVEKHSVIGIRLDVSISTRSARVEDSVSATVSRDVTVNGRTAIPAGARLEGTVVLVERGGRFKNRPRLGLRFERMIMADGTRVALKTDTIYREGDSPSADATAKVGAGAVAGAILGAVLGGKKGAALGSAAGAAGGAASVMRGDPGEVSLPAGAPLTVRLVDELTVAIQR